MSKIAIGFSGGVDSAVSAALLQKQGHDVLGVFLWCYQTKDFPCTTDEDRAMAVRVADHLHIPIKIIDLRRDYRRSVIDYFFAEYKAGRTPNPDVMCNKEIKFGLFYEQMIEKEKFDYVATGHYARILTRLSGEESASWRTTTPESNKDRFWTCLRRQASQNDGSLFLAKGIDDTKDQSYFLYTLKEKQLEHIMFPVGEYKKEQVRKMAMEFKLPNAQRPDSQGICFIGEVDVKKFLKTKLKPKKGLVLNAKGDVMGEHEGVWFYTIGQRHGFNINNLPHPNPLLLGEGEGEVGGRKPLYILSKNSERNELVVGEKDECYTKSLEIDKMHWISSTVVPASFSVIPAQAGIHNNNYIDSHFHGNDKVNLTVRIRHLGEMYPCKISPVIPSDPPSGGESRNLLQNKSVEKDPSIRPSDSLGMTSYRVILAKPAFAVASGQSAVIYNGDIVLGGGIIK